MTAVGATAIPARRPVYRWLRTSFRRARARSRIELDRIIASLAPADVSFFHEFVPPPAGGGHQFMRALARELRSRGVSVAANAIGSDTTACLVNSFNFDPERLRRHRRDRCRIVHRVDGPAALYRGVDDGTDTLLARLNGEFATITVFQSAFSRDAYQRLGLGFTTATIIPNAADPRIFHPPEVPRTVARGRRLRVIAASWSNNPNKGADIYAEFAEQTRGRVDFTFVGRTSRPIPGARMVPPIPSEALAVELRAHDLFLTASRNDPCSNAVVEALSCGLPVIYLRSGGHPELVGEAGYGFEHPAELPLLIERAADEHQVLVSRIRIARLAAVADAYLHALGVGPGVDE
ncbi:MAG: glycosyltransferase [Gemmatimonadota bacterium]